MLHYSDKNYAVWESEKLINLKNRETILKEQIESTLNWGIYYVIVTNVSILLVGKHRGKVSLIQDVYKQETFPHLPNT